MAPREEQPERERETRENVQLLIYIHKETKGAPGYEVQRTQRSTMPTGGGELRPELCQVNKQNWTIP